MPKPLAFLFAGALALAGCTQTDERAPSATPDPAPLPTTHPAPPSPSAQPGPGTTTRPSPEPADSECGAEKLGDYVNQLPSTEAMARIQTAVGHDRIRTIRPGDAVTMDFRPDRLNVEIGPDGRIKLFRCG